jgi:hypothetical protein
MFEQQYMLEMVETRRASADIEDRHDLFSGLLKESQDELDNGAALSDEELIGKHSNVAPFLSLKHPITLDPRKRIYFSSRWT